MHRFLVCSDIHRNCEGFVKALNMAAQEGVIEKIFIAGDLELPPDSVADAIYNCEGFDKTPDFYMVKGNCDEYNCGQAGDIVIDNIPGGHKILLTHGHRYQVKSDHSILAAIAKAKGCDIAIFGHTHMFCKEYQFGVHLLNPGAINFGYMCPNGFAILTTDGNGALDFVHIDI
ncbi:MAG: YfcE family phosphodiesterase [Clostridiales bacterium]|nr:YfcE family phosphodiesterase [Clostridiales bacterium]